MENPSVDHRLFLLFYASTFGVLFMLRKKRTRRFPLPDNTKLLRMPGEQLWRDLTKSEENDDLFVIGAVVVPLIAVVIVFELIRPLVNQWPIATIIVLISTIIVSIWLTGRFMAKRFFARRTTGRNEPESNPFSLNLGESPAISWLRFYPDTGR